MSQPNAVAGLFRRYPLASVCLVAWVVLLVGFVYRFGELDLAKATLAEKETEATRIGRNVQNGTGLDKQVEALAAGLAKLEVKLIRADEVGPNQQYFYDLEAAAGVKVSVLRCTGVSKAAKGTLFSPVGYNVAVEGRFSNAVAFLQALELGAHHYRLSNFTVQRAGQAQAADDKGGNVILNLNLELLASS